MNIPSRFLPLAIAFTAFAAATPALAAGPEISVDELAAATPALGHLPGDGQSACSADETRPCYPTDQNETG